MFEIIQNNLVIGTPFDRDHTDIPFDQITYFENIFNELKKYNQLYQNVKNQKLKLIFMFKDAWATVNKFETHKQDSGNIMALDLYNILYKACEKEALLNNSLFVTSTNTDDVLQHADWPIYYFNEPFNRYFEYEHAVNISSKPFDKHFLWLNRRTRNHRLYALHQAYKLKLFDDCIYTFHDYQCDIADHISNLKQYLPKEKIDINFRKARTKSNKLNSHYDIIQDKQEIKQLISLKSWADSCYLEIVSEYLASDYKVFHTEKTARSIVMGKPFIILGDKGSLQSLKRLGFKTFDSFWSEDYDNLPTAQERVDAALDVICDIRKNIDPKQGYSNSMLDIIRHNQNHYFQIYRKQQLDLYARIME